MTMEYNGFINFLKPPGMTSHDAVSCIRRIYGQKKVGHAGTLDPAAAGVLPIALGQATRLIEFMSEVEKGYIAEIWAGIKTDSGDDTGKVLLRDENVVWPEDLAALEAQFSGTIWQQPPQYSAIKIQGERAYNLARNNIQVDMPKRQVTVHALTLNNSDDERKIMLEARCSKGTYIRSLCQDIGAYIGIPATMGFLLRTQVGPFLLEEAVSEMEIRENPLERLLPLSFAQHFLPVFTLLEPWAVRFQHGQTVRIDTFCKEEVVLVKTTEENYLGVGKIMNKYLKPVKVFPSVD